jgi:hypothetical protein
MKLVMIPLKQIKASQFPVDSALWPGSFQHFDEIALCFAKMAANVQTALLPCGLSLDLIRSAPQSKANL